MQSHCELRALVDLTPSYNMESDLKRISKCPISSYSSCLSENTFASLDFCQQSLRTGVPDPGAPLRSFLYEAASVMDSQMLDTAHGQIHVLTCGPSDGEA